MKIEYVRPAPTPELIKSSRLIRLLIWAGALSVVFVFGILAEWCYVSDNLVEWGWGDPIVYGTRIDEITKAEFVIFIVEFRRKYPECADISNDEIARRLCVKYLSDIRGQKITFNF